MPVKIPNKLAIASGPTGSSTVQEANDSYDRFALKYIFSHENFLWFLVQVRFSAFLLSSVRLSLGFFSVIWVCKPVFVFQEFSYKYCN